MKKEIINIIKILGIGLNEIILDIDLGFFLVNSIEFREPNEIILHNFTDDGEDCEISYDDIEPKYKKHLWKLLSILLYN
jgi:hypothetical protein